MARTNLKAVSVYVTEEQNDRLSKAASLTHRSLSNFLLALGLEEADTLGFTAIGVQPASQADKQRAASGAR